MEMEEDLRKTDPDEVIARIQSYKSQIIAMDNLVHRYVSDREKYKNPIPEKLIEEIRRFEARVHQMLSKDVQFWLEGLMHSVVVHERSWQRLFEIEEEQFREQQEMERLEKLKDTLIDE